jgi:hypothetical protein
MRLSELVVRCEGDPELTIEDEHGVPRPVVDIDLGVMLTPSGPATYVLLEPARGDDE